MDKGALDTTAPHGEETSTPPDTTAADTQSASFEPSVADLIALEKITEVALTTTDLDELLQRLIQRMVEVSGAQAGAILLLEGDELIPRATYGLDERIVAAYRVPRGVGFAGQVLQEDRPLTTRNAIEEGQGWIPYLNERGIRSMLGVPLRANGQVIGVAHIDLVQERDFTPREIHRFQVLADRAAIAIEHSRLLRESRERAAQLEAANAQLREVDRLKTEFLSMISHELRTPLTAIIGYTDLLLRGTHGPLNERQMRHQRAVKSGAHRLLELINDLLDVSRLESGLVELERSEISLAGVLQKAVAGARQAADEARLTLRLELPERLPTVYADEARLVQVFANLLSNAVKFTPEGGWIVVRAATTPDGQRVQVFVEDNGIGIRPEHLAHIWDRFYQAESGARRRYGGTGLGLAIVRRLVELHDGEVHASSPGPGRGASFRVDLPVHRPVAPAAPAQPDLGRYTVLVVEDQADNRDLLATLLQEMLGVRVITASNGLEALERLKSRPDLVLLDMMLPHLNGFDVVRLLRDAEQTRDIPVVALTALSQPNEQAEALAAGCDDLIVKPFDTDTLIEKVASKLRVLAR